MSKPKGYTNPALQAMGIPALRIPSRNWLIFWAFTGTAVGLWAYDRRERKKVRQSWKDQVSPLAQRPMDPMQMPRKVTVYIAPPPGDFIDVGLQHFRNYIKPILVAGAVDYEVRSETRQGEIRSFVATEIRNRRRKALGLDPAEEQDEIEERLQKNVKKNTQNEVICVGRGAYKEYLNGLHEGWLGPLQPPADIVNDSIDSTNADTAEKPQDQASVTNEIPGNSENSQISENTEKTEKTEKTENTENKKEKKPIPKPYITSDQYSEAQIPAEMDQINNFPTLGAIAQPHLIGFLNIPRRIFRFYNQRALADEICGQTAAVVLGKSRPFDNKIDPEALIDDESEWPAKWKKTALENHSEWMRPFNVDERITSHIKVYEYDN